ncbi:proton channel OtopLc-like isoform X2 [Phlebotomus argentipes]|uniref:proton channel OtopLc-like isoform X2 n=1 Tax=Phlebotomus argentipes TaxID=94469 RepID=UPI00289334DB|nr:proton channel OtopLc-like isoform X2 [Phlebotomus argentipes]XP_059616660.1 proton channel OtopLc-like isoform X2 [Phlebotomus argentipes]XP_059616661.1 proton channel OtopLc-like isoform X2 [Phlebotomus argentipes]XP_059616662.1 proton channel OtopLc-like isoform X2 [Phlebotomus argentipes]
MRYQHNRMTVTFRDTSEENDQRSPVQSQEAMTALVPSGSALALNNPHQELSLSRRPSVLLQEILSTRRPSAIMAALTRPQRQRLNQMDALHENPDMRSGSLRTLNGFLPTHHASGGAHSEQAQEYKRKNRRIGDDALSTALSALYCKLLVVMGIAMPVTEILSSRIPANFYQGFYVYLYAVSIAFVIFIYATHLRTRAVFSLLKDYHEKANNTQHIKKRAAHFGSFYLRVGAIAFAIGTMVYSGLEFGQYFELNGNPGCSNIYMALTPVARMLLCIIQMKFIFLNTTELDMARHKVVARFGLMHMVATNLCEWLYVLVEETKHEIFHLSHTSHGGLGSAAAAILSTTANPLASTDAENATASVMHNITKRSVASENLTDGCHRTNIMGSLVQNASPFLFPCTIEYSLICAVILYEMWKQVKTIPNIEKTRRNSQKPHTKSAHHFSVDCARAHRGMFAGILVIVLTIICLIMFFVLHDVEGYEMLAIQEVTICEILMYAVTTMAVLAAMYKMRDLRYQQKIKDNHHASTVSLDCTLLVLAQSGVYVYAMFSIMGCYFAMETGVPGSQEGFVAEICSLLQTSMQTLFVLNASWRRCRGAQQNRTKPGREIVTFLLVANMSMWFINTLIKGHAGFRPTHLHFFGVWAWTVITHVSMPLAIFYRFHSTICLFEIWKSAYKVKNDH